jgi:uncharacterized RDD family membrane protein YckC
MTDTIEQSFTISNRKRRIAAFLIDHCVLSFIIVAMAILALYPKFIDESDTRLLAIKMALVMIPGFFLYFAKDSLKGISIGRWVMGIMVRDEYDHNSVPSFGKLLIRNLFLIIWPVEFLVLASSYEKKRLGDKVTKTIVLNNPDKPERRKRFLTLLGIGLLILGFAYFLGGAAMRNSDAYKVAVKNIEINKQIIEETGGIEGYGKMPTGSIEITNGYGKAQLHIRVIGRTRNITVDAYLAKEPNGTWKLIEINN